jgi:hypothetical protein
LVDLEVIDIEFFQVGQRRIAGAKIVDSHLDAGFAIFHEFIDDAGRGIQQQPLSDFNGDVAAWQAQ